MQIGTFLPTYWASYGRSTLAEALTVTAQAADALGYASLWANDHVIAPPTQAEMGHIIEPLITLASVAPLVPRLGLGTSTLVLPQRHPVLVAKQVAALDVLSGGRVTLGIGVGWLAEEFAMLGADFAHRGAVADEAIAVLRAVWREERATVHGRYYVLREAVCAPKPAHEVPLWMCGNTRAAIRRAAHLCEGWNPFGIGLDDFRAGVALLRRLTEAAGRPRPTVAAHLRLFIGEGGAREAHVAGSVATVTAALQAYQQAGLEYLICDFVAEEVDDLLRQMRLMAEQVAPAVRVGRRRHAGRHRGAAGPAGCAWPYRDQTGHMARTPADGVIGQGRLPRHERCDMRGYHVVFSRPGRADLEAFEVPPVGPHQVLIRTEVSLISAGTELTAFLNASGTVRYPMHPGYSNVGIVAATGPALTTPQVGERVLTLGPHASHCLVDLAEDRPGGPEYLQVIADDLRPEDASFAILGSVAIHGIRKAAPCLGQSAAVMGQGLVGQLLAQLLRLNGCWPVIGIDTLPLRLRMARESGTALVLNAAEGDLEAAVREATLGAGVDLAFDATRNPQTLPTLMEIAALSGKVIIVGSIPGKAEIALFDPLQTKELTIIGAWQPRSPVAGHAYFPWTQSRNRLAFLNLVRERSLQVSHLITHQVAPHEAARTYEMIRDGTEWLGILFRWADAP